MAMFQKRHYDYLAEQIARQPNRDMKVFLRLEMGSWFSRDMEGFNLAKWNEVCEKEK